MAFWKDAPVKVISCKQRHGAQHLAVPFPDELRLIGNGKALPAYDRIFNAVARADQRPKPAGFTKSSTLERSMLPWTAWEGAHSAKWSSTSLLD